MSTKVFLFAAISAFAVPGFSEVTLSSAAADASTEAVTKAFAEAVSIDRPPVAE